MRIIRTIINPKSMKQFILPSENLLIFRRTICNLSNENWTPGIRSKFAKWFLLK